MRAVGESLLRGVFETALDGIVMTGEDQLIVLANAAAARMLGCSSSQDMVGSPLARFIPESCRAMHGDAMRKFGRSGAAVRHMGRRREVQAMRTDGTLFPAEATISHIEIDGLGLYTATLRDMSEARQAEQALRDSEAMLRRLLMNLPEAVFVNSGNRVSFVNEAAQRLFGGDEAALLGRAPLELIAPQSRALVHARIAALSPRAPVAPLTELGIQRLDGSERRVESVGTLIAHRGESAILVVLRDVTELRQARTALEQSHADLQRLVAALEQTLMTERKRIARELHDDLQQTLSAIRMDTFLLRENCGGPNDAATLARIDGLAEAAMASTRRLVNDLRPLPLEEMGLTEALKAMAQRFAERSGITCEVTVPPPDAANEPAATLAHCLFRVAQEALNNVGKHAHCRQAEVSLRRDQDGGWTLRIRDDGCGIQPGDPRKPKCYGLLGMGERLRALGGALKVSRRSEGGTCVEATLPPPPRMD
ncbi:PAS domain-containing sensor histidine kinase [Ideonella azotifigens]|nr:PAS domain S-box protein [Ideonella azotifigens]